MVINEGFETTATSSNERNRMLKGALPEKRVVSSRMQIPVTRIRDPRGITFMGGREDWLVESGW
jgi:hypothetical protein